MMDAEKNVVEAARRARDSYFRFGSSMTPEHGNAMIALRAALSAYDSAPAPSEDRVREAAVKALRGFVGNDVFEPSARAIDDVADAIRHYVTPAPALPAGTVAVSVETLREIRRDAVSTHTMEGYPESSCSIAKTIDALLPPPARPEPPKELVAEWERMATKYVRDLMLGGPDAAFLEHSPHVMRAYVAALRAAWEADPKGKQ